MTTTTHRYAIGLGSNRRGRHGAPAAMLRAAMSVIDGIVARSAIIASAPIGPSARRFANAVAIVETTLPPRALLARLKRIERDFGRRPARRWAARPLDLDILLWSGGIWSDPQLSIPHPAFAERRFVVDPLAALVPEWRDPRSGQSIRQIAARARAVDRRPCRP